MTTLTSSPSPASSPRLSFHHPSPRAHFSPAHRSPTASRTSPRPSYSPRRAFNAPAKPSTSSQQQPQKQQQQQQPPRSSDGGAVTSSGGAGFVYADVGTQYSPDGLPPTAGRKVAATVGQPPGSTTASSSANAGASARKRKEAAPTDSPPHQPMSGSSASSGAHQQPPAEPPVRTEPARPSSITGATTSTEPEPQEARSTHGHSAAPKRSRADPGSLKVMPLKYETCNPKELGVLIANMLMELIRINDKIPLRDGRLTRFHSRAPPGISVSDYLQRLIQHATLSPPIMLSMVYYIDRLCTLYPAFTINSLTVHRFLITAATVAAKGLSDSFWTNPTYARIGGIPVSELATLELELLQRVEWKIVPRPEVLEDYYSSLVDRTEGYTMEESTGSGSDSSSLVESSPSSKAGQSKKQDEEMADNPT